MGNGLGPMIYYVLVFLVGALLLERVMEAIRSRRIRRDRELLVVKVRLDACELREYLAVLIDETHEILPPTREIYHRVVEMYFDPEALDEEVPIEYDGSPSGFKWKITDARQVVRLFRGGLYRRKD